MHYLAPLTVFATTTKDELIGLVVVLGLATVVLFSMGFLAMALFVNRTMRQEEERPPTKKTRAPTTHA